MLFQKNINKFFIKRIKRNSILPIITGIIVLLFFCCDKTTEPTDPGNNYNETDSTSIGEITRTYTGDGKLLKVETTNGTFYNRTFSDTNEIIDRSSDGSCMGGTCYKTYQSIKDLYAFWHFVYDGEVQITIEQGYVLLGYTKIGYFEGVVIPKRDQIFEYTELIQGNTLKKEFKGNIEFIYFRYEPGQVEELFGSLYQLKESEALSSNQIEELYHQAVSVHNSYCWYVAHSGDYVYLERDIFSMMLKLKDQSLLYNEFVSPVLNHNKIYRREQNGNLTDLIFEYCFNRVQEDLLIAYCSDNSIVKNDLENWLSHRNTAFDSICQYLKLNWNYGMITFFVFNDDEEAAKYMIGPLGFALPHKNEIYTRHNQTYGHELTHVISYHIDNGKRIESALINEGLATWLSMRGDKCNYHRIAKEYMETGKLDECNLLNEGFRNCNLGYFLGASFVGYLIDAYGVDLFKSFFAQEQYSEYESFQIYYSKDYYELYNEWKIYLIITDFGELTDYETNILDTLG